MAPSSLPTNMSQQQIEAVLASVRYLVDHHLRVPTGDARALLSAYEQFSAENKLLREENETLKNASKTAIISGAGTC